MSKRQYIMIIGVWVAFFLFMGFPSGWDKILSLLTGLLIIVIAYRMKPNVNDKNNSNNVFGNDKPISENKFDVPYVEHKNEKIISNGSLNNE